MQDAAQLLEEATLTSVYPDGQIRKLAYQALDIGMTNGDSNARKSEVLHQRTGPCFKQTRHIGTYCCALLFDFGLTHY